MDTEDSKMTEANSSLVNGDAVNVKADKGGEKMFTLKKWNAVAMWSWDVECDTCAICRVQVSITKRYECILYKVNRSSSPGDGRMSEMSVGGSPWRQGLCRGLGRL